MGILKKCDSNEHGFVVALPAANGMGGNHQFYVHVHTFHDM